MAPIPRRVPHFALLALGVAGGLALALPLDLAGDGCPPPGEGRNLCLLQEAWAPAATTVALCAVLGWLVAELLFVRLPDAKAGRRPRKPPRRGHGREAIEADEVLRAASWGVLPPPRRREPAPAITVAAIAGGPPELRAVRPLDRPTPPPGREVKRVRRPVRPSEPDGSTLAACWDVATRRSAQLVDAAAVDLGLSRERLRPAPASDPDPLLTAATWARAPQAPEADGSPGRLARLLGRRAAPPPAPAPPDDPLLAAASWASHSKRRRAA